MNRKALVLTIIAIGVVVFLYIKRAGSQDHGIVRDPALAAASSRDTSGGSTGLKESTTPSRPNHRVLLNGPPHKPVQLEVEVVSGDTGRALIGATVRIIGVDIDGAVKRLQWEGPIDRSDAMGRASLALPPEALTSALFLTVEAEHYAPFSQRIERADFGRNKPPIRIELNLFEVPVRSTQVTVRLIVSSDRGSLLREFLVWTASEPHEGSAFRKLSEGVNGPYECKATTSRSQGDQLGAIVEAPLRFNERSGESYLKVWITSPGFVEKTVEVRVLEQDLGREIVLEIEMDATSFALQGVVLDASTLSPISGARVVAQGTGSGPNSRGMLIAETSTDLNGHFQTRSPIFDEAPSLLGVSAEGYMAQYSDLTLTDSQGATVEVLLSKATTIRGRVVDLSGTPVAYRILAVVSDEPGPPPMGMAAIQRKHYALAVCDERGEFAIDLSFHAQRYSLIATNESDLNGMVRAILRSGRGTTTWKSVAKIVPIDQAVLAGAHFDVLLGTGFPVEGTVLAPPHSLQSRSQGYAALFDTTQPSLACVASIDSNGHFSFRDVEAGEYDLSLYHHDVGWQSRARVTLDGNGPYPIVLEPITYAD